MGVLAPLVKRAQPALLGGGCSAAATEGTTWQWVFVDVVDDSGNPVDLSAVTGAATIYSGSTPMLTLTFAGGSGTFTLSKDESATIGLAAGATVQGRRCAWGLTLSDGTDIVQAWGPSNSDFVILKATG